MSQELPEHIDKILKKALSGKDNLYPRRIMEDPLLLNESYGNHLNDITSARVSPDRPVNGDEDKEDKKDKKSDDKDD